MNRKRLYTVIALILLIMLYIMIFFLSSEDADSSSNVSMKVTKALLRIYYRISGGNGGQLVTGYVASSAENIVRKLAHFTEYACVGFLSYSIVVTWYGTIWKGRLFVVLQLLLSAGADEFHQYFVPGRHASVKDVLIDTAGGIAGMVVILIWSYMRKKIVRWFKSDKNGK